MSRLLWLALCAVVGCAASMRPAPLHMRMGVDGQTYYCADDGQHITCAYTGVR